MGHSVRPTDMTSHVEPASSCLLLVHNGLTVRQRKYVTNLIKGKAARNSISTSLVLYHFVVASCFCRSMPVRFLFFFFSFLVFEVKRRHVQLTRTFLIKLGFSLQVNKYILYVGQVSIFVFLFPGFSSNPLYSSGHDAGDTVRDHLHAEKKNSFFLFVSCSFREMWTIGWLDYRFKEELF